MAYNTVQIEIRGIPMEVVCDVTPGDRETHDGYGAPVTQASDAELDIVKVIVGIHEGETEIEITPLIADDAFVEIKEKCWLVLNDQGVPDDPEMYESIKSTGYSVMSSYTRLMDLLK